MSNFVVRRLPNAKLYYLLGMLQKFSFSITASVELYYFSAFLTDSAMFRNAIVVLVMSVTSVLDLLLSFTVSIFLSSFKLPWGKARSWLLIAPPIVLVFYTLVFTRLSPNELLSAVIIIVGFVVSHLFWNIGEAANNAMALEMTDDPNERVNLAVWFGRGANLAILPFSIIATFLISRFEARIPSFGYAGLALTMSLLYVVCYLIMFLKTKYILADRSGHVPKPRTEATKESALKGIVLGF